MDDLLTKLRTRAEAAMAILKHRDIVWNEPIDAGNMQFGHCRTCGAGVILDVMLAERSIGGTAIAIKCLDKPIIVEFGRVLMTSGAKESLVHHPASVYWMLARHKAGDWGDVAEEDRMANNDALQSGDRLLSAYTVHGTKYWVITEADRSVTTILLPEEY